MKPALRWYEGKLRQTFSRLVDDEKCLPLADALWCMPSIDGPGLLRCGSVGMADLSSLSLQRYFVCIREESMARRTSHQLSFAPGGQARARL